MLVQLYFLIPPNTSKSEKVKSTILIPKGKVKEIVVRFLSGVGDLTHFSITSNSHCFYHDSPKEGLNVKRLIRLDAKDYDLPFEVNPIRLEGYNDDSKRKAILKVDFALVPDSDSNLSNLLQKGV